MALPPLIRPHVHSYPTLESAIWFLQLRWVAVLGQLLTLAVVTWGLRIELRGVSLLSMIGVTAISNAAYWFWLIRLHRSGVTRTDRLSGDGVLGDQVITGLLLLDICTLTGMLYFSGGLTNPFALFYFVNIAVAGAIVTPIWAWMCWLATVAGVFLLMLDSVPISILTSHFPTLSSGTDAWSIPKVGEFVAFAACGGVITYFITILTGELRQRENELQEAEAARIRNRQLEALATLAGGAAHELATPLSTIAVVAKELGRSLEKIRAPESLSQDVALIRDELNRCREILNRMTSAAGEAAGEGLRRITLDEFLQECLVGLREPQRVQVKTTSSEQVNLLPVQAAAQALRNLMQNALDATPATQPIEVSASTSDSHWQIQVIDHGTGMSPEVLERVGEPFFTTKEPGRGMGLGLYLTENVLRRLDGTLQFSSRLGQGTTALVTLPTER
ncbi:MAG: HAMP domain-containing histidine kinase [Planctomycetales bacterium]|nr:HAMP domain-containing histidine kinase [Planctomycetales bacterium]